jgi:multimeric flavodoxin WrbA
MKVLIISSSPRKGGNSDTLCDRFLAGATDAGHTVEKIRLAEKDIAPCNACAACFKAGSCVIRDDAPEILQKMVDADVIVLASPVYFYSMTAQMKLLIDRCYSHFRAMIGKTLYFIITCADDKSGTIDTLGGLRGLLRCLPSGKEGGVIIANTQSVFS